MKLIKFRGKECVTDKWVYGDLLRFCGGTLIYYGSQTKSESAVVLEEKGRKFAVTLHTDELSFCYPETIGQFTGLLNREGREIYEHDVVLVDGIYCVVCWDNNNATFCLVHKGEKYAGAFPIDPMKLDIIGNVHDHPELAIYFNSAQWNLEK